MAGFPNPGPWPHSVGGKNGPGGAAPNMGGGMQQQQLPQVPGMMPGMLPGMMPGVPPSIGMPGMMPGMMPLMMPGMPGMPPMNMNMNFLNAFGAGGGPPGPGVAGMKGPPPQAPGSKALPTPSGAGSQTPSQAAGGAQQGPGAPSAENCSGKQQGETGSFASGGAAATKADPRPARPVYNNQPPKRDAFGVAIPVNPDLLPPNSVVLPKEPAPTEKSSAPTSLGNASVPKSGGMRLVIQQSSESSPGGTKHVAGTDITPKAASHQPPLPVQTSNPHLGTMTIGTSSSAMAVPPSGGAAVNGVITAAPTSTAATASTSSSAPAPTATGPPPVAQPFLKPKAAPLPATVIHPNFKPTVYVSKLPQDIPDLEMQEIFSVCGRIASWKRNTDPVSNLPAAFAFCEFADVRGLHRALVFLNSDSNENPLYNGEEMRLLEAGLVLKVAKDAKEQITKWRDFEREEFRKTHPDLCNLRKIGEEGGEGEDEPHADEDVDALMLNECDGEIRELLKARIAAANAKHADKLTSEQRAEREKKIQESEKHLAERKAKLEDKKREEEARAREAAEAAAAAERTATVGRAMDVSGGGVAASGTATAERELPKPHRKERLRLELMYEEEKRQKREDDVAVRSFERREPKALEDFKRQLEQLNVREGPDHTVIPMDTSDAHGSSRAVHRDGQPPDNKSSSEKLSAGAKELLQRDRRLMEQARPRRRKIFEGITKREADQLARELLLDEEDVEKEKQELIEREKEVLKKEQLELEQKLQEEEERKTREAIERMTGGGCRDRRGRSADSGTMSDEGEHDVGRETRGPGESRSSDRDDRRRRSGGKNRDPSRDRGGETARGRHGREHRDEQPRDKNREDGNRRSRSRKREKSPREGGERRRERRSDEGRGPEKAKDLQFLIQTIPEGMAVFEQQIKWNILEANDLLEAKVRPWIAKKVKEMYDKEEPAVIEYIYSVVLKVKQGKMTTDDMLHELEKFLDEETQKFCIKLWRCIILSTLELELRAARERIGELQKVSQSRATSSTDPAGSRSSHPPLDEFTTIYEPQSKTSPSSSTTRPPELSSKEQPDEENDAPTHAAGGSPGGHAETQNRGQRYPIDIDGRAAGGDEHEGDATTTSLAASLQDEIRTLKLQNQSLRKQCERKDVELRLQDERWKEEFNCFKLQKEELQRTCKALSSKNSRVNVLLAETKELQGNLTTYRERLDALRAKNVRYETEERNYEGRIKALSEVETKLKEKLQSEMRKNDEWLAEKRDLENGRVKLLQELSAQSNVADSCQAELADLRAQVVRAAAEKESWSQEQSELRRSSAALQTETCELKREKAALQKRTEQLQGELAQLFESREALKIEYRENLSKMESWKDRCKVLEPDLAETTKTNIQLEEKLKYLEQELLHESEQRAKFQREALLNVDRARGLSRKCEQLSDRVQLQESKNTAHFQKVLEQQQQQNANTPKGSAASAPSPAHFGQDHFRQDLSAAASKSATGIAFLRKHVANEERKMLQRKKLQEETAGFDAVGAEAP